ncbi:MAG: 1,4-dihydroxy-2-naphthoate polyprenyltransferase [Candidatus Zixiibacteriota bacterium]
MAASSIAVWILAARPKTLWAAVAPVIIGTAMAVEAQAVHWLSAAAALLGAVLIQVGTNYANDYFDYVKGADQPDRLGPTRVTQAGLVTPKQMRMATIVIYVLAFFVGVYLVWRGGWPIAVIGLLSILFGVMYTAGPLPLGYYGLGDPFVLVFFGPVAVGGTFYVQTLDINSVVLLAGLAPGLFSVAILTVNNLRDIESDRRAGKKTLAVRFGAAYVRTQYVLAVLVASSLPIVLHLVTGGHQFVMLTTLTILAAIPAFRSVLGRAAGVELNATLATTGKLLLLYSILFSIGWVV